MITFWDFEKVKGGCAILVAMNEVRDDIKKDGSKAWDSKDQNISTKYGMFDVTKGLLHAVASVANNAHAQIKQGMQVTQNALTC